MYSIADVRKYISVLLIQDIVLFLTLTMGAYVLWFGNAGQPLANPWLKAEIFFAVLFITVLLLAVWNVLVNLTEGLWSIRAESRVRRWLIVSLRVGAVFSLAGLVLIGWRQAFGPNSAATITTSPMVLSIILILAAAVPLAASSLLTAGLIKHFIGVRKNNEKMLDSLKDKNAELERLNVSILSNANQVSTSARPHPKGFYVAGMSSKPWHESEEYAWAKNFEDSFEDILKEAKAVLGESLEKLEHYHYPGIDTGRWRIFSFVADRTENPENLAQCPATAKALKSIPGYPFFRDAMFSILEPGGVIKPHRDDSNLFLTMHFGLLTPGDGFMEVAGMRRPWVAGKGIFFDSAYEHQAVNNSKDPRAVLLVDFLNPELTEAEREWIAASPLWRH